MSLHVLSVPMEKASHRPPAGLLCPLPVPGHPWSHIALDFISGLPPSCGNTTVLTMVDWFSKTVDFVALPKLPSAQETTDHFAHQDFHLHRIPVDIVSNRGPQFVSQVWKAFCQALGASVSLSSSFHPQTNGQTERVNQDLEATLHCVTANNPSTWSHHLLSAEFAHNSLIELLDFKGEDLTDCEDRGIIRRIKKTGQGYSCPNEGATVEVYVEGWCDGALFDQREVKFVVGEGEDHDIPIGVDKALEKMQRGEHCILHLKPKYGFGDHGKPGFNIPPNSQLDYEVLLKNFVKAKESWEMDTHEKLEQAAIVKEKGTSYFKRGKYEQAQIQYRKIVAWLDQYYGLSEEDSWSAKALVLAAHLNMAMCCLKLNDYLKAVKSCDKALEIDRLNEKALYRRGEARLSVNEFDLAKADFQEVLQVNPDNKAARAQLLMCQRRIKEHHEKNKKIYANMFQKFADRDLKGRRGKSSREKGSNMLKEVEEDSPEEKKPREAA
ncbi:peptidyl-prolyl cis-trans isomerase FKBP5-like isoform X1 [Hypanus sabinus]|uniref:peptidyl-prolyl cis-trans isomerase FKBP5-like isoform X1 n=1 Tax=Hypanus sabinus TaxID=79690 RepID=UPI0028C3E064|nr:peptidyl-prolyl cis-trans isomerase FKBP5-like isoform X1 [Hypanus sabinus]